MPYAPAVHIVGACDLMFLSGATPSPLYHKHPHVDAEHVHPHSIEEQTDRAMEAIKSILDHVGASWRDVVKVTKYLTDFREADAMHKTMHKYFGDWKPASHHGVHQLAVVARRAHRARYDRGAAEEGHDASAEPRAHRRSAIPAFLRCRDGAPARGGGAAARRARLRASRLLRRQPFRLGGAVADAMAGDRRSGRGVHAGRARRAVRAICQPRAAGAAARRQRRTSSGAANPASRPRAPRWKSAALPERPHRLYRAADGGAACACLSTRFPNIANLSRAYIKLRQVKSAEELDWLRIGAHFSATSAWQRCAMALRRASSERELGGVVERAYVAQGATNVIHYIGTTVDGGARSRRAAAVSDHALLAER